MTPDRWLLGAAIPTAAAALALTLAACSGDSTDSGTSAGAQTAVADPGPAEPTQSAEPTVDPSTYLLTNREQFLAASPDCAGMTAWYEANPVDVDPSAVARFIEQCDAFPPELLTNQTVVRAATAAILASSIPATDPARVRIHHTLAESACEMYDSGTRSPYSVATDVADQGGTPADYQAAIKEATMLCPEHRADLTVFAPADIVGAGGELSTFVTQNWPDAIGTFPEWIGAAQYVCTEKQGRAEGAAMFVEHIIGPGGVDEFVTWTHKNLCAD